MSEQPNSRYAGLRDSFAAMREFIMVGAMLALLFAPERVRDVLDAAGIRSLAGVEFDATTLTNSEAEIEKAKLQVTELEKNLALAQQQLAKFTQSSGNRIDPALGTVSQLLANAQRSLIEAETNLDRSKEMSSEFLRRHGSRRSEIQYKPSSERQTQRLRTMPQVQQAQQPLTPPEQLFQR